MPPGGGRPEVWLADRKLDGVDFGTTGIMLAADRSTLLVAQGSSAGGGDGNPATGKIYKVPIRSDGKPGAVRRFWESGPTDLPDGFAIARSGRLYVPLVGTTAQIAVVSPTGREIERFPKVPFTGDNGSSVPFDSPSSAMFLGTRLIVANQSAVAGERANQALLDVEAGERGLAPFIPSGAGTSRKPIVCIVRKVTKGGRGAPFGKAKRMRGQCTVSVRVKPGRHRFKLRRLQGRLVDSGSARADRRGRLEIPIENVGRGRYRLRVSDQGGRVRRSIRVRAGL